MPSGRFLSTLRIAPSAPCCARRETGQAELIFAQTAIDPLYGGNACWLNGRVNSSLPAPCHMFALWAASETDPSRKANETDAANLVSMSHRRPPFMCMKTLLARFCTTTAYSRGNGVSRCPRTVLPTPVQPRLAPLAHASSVLPFQYGVPKPAVVFRLVLTPA